MAKTFQELFAGRPDAHGYYGTPEQQLGGVKREAKRGTLEEKVEQHHWDDHLNGVMGLGVVPVMHGDCVNWGCIDVDKYESLGALCIKIEKRIQKLQLPLVVTRTKSGGAHCWVFFSKPAPAYQVIEKLKEWTKLIGFMPGQKVDIFPAQESIANLDAGSWVNIPYFDNANNAQDRVGYGTNCKPLSLDDFVAHANVRMIHPADLDRADEGIETVEVAGEDVHVDHAQAPPCIQCMLSRGVVDSRNNAMRQAGVYLSRAHPDDWKDRLMEMNQEVCDPPLAYAEMGPMARNIEQQGQRARYFCDRAPMVNNCDKGVCLTRDFGIGDKTHAGLDFEITKLTKHEGDEPFYEVWIDNKEIRMSYEVLISTAKFGIEAGKILNKLLRVPKKFDWVEHINTLMSTEMAIEKNFQSLSMGNKALATFNDWVRSFHTSSDAIERVLEGAPVYMPKVKKLAFLPGDLNKVFVKQGLMLKAAELIPILRQDIKASEVSYQIGSQELSLFEISYDAEPWFVEEGKTDDEF